MRNSDDGPKNTFGLDFEEDPEGLIRFLNWTGTASSTAGGMLLVLLVWWLW